MRSQGYFFTIILILLGPGFEPVTSRVVGKRWPYILSYFTYNQTFNLDMPRYENEPKTIALIANFEIHLMSSGWLHFKF
jgi:hypothetical protein